MNEHVLQVAHNLQFVWLHVADYTPASVKSAYEKAGFEVINIIKSDDLVVSLEVRTHTGDDYRVMSRGTRTAPNIEVPEGAELTEAPPNVPSPENLRAHTCANCSFWEKCGHDYQWNGEPIEGILDIDAAGECRCEAPVIHQSALVQGPIAAWPVTHEDWWCGKHSASAETTAERAETLAKALRAEARDLLNDHAQRNKFGGSGAQKGGS